MYFSFSCNIIMSKDILQKREMYQYGIYFVLNYNACKHEKNLVKMLDLDGMKYYCTFQELKRQRVIFFAEFIVIT